MAVLQNNFADDIQVGYPGMEADGELSNILTRSLESASVGFGKALFRGSNDRGAVTTPAAGTLLGFTIANPGLALTADRPADTYIVKDNVRIKNRGKIWVMPAVNVADGDDVFITSGGAITNASSGNIAADGWKFDDTATSGTPVRLVRR